MAGLTPGPPPRLRGGVAWPALLDAADLDIAVANQSARRLERHRTTRVLRVVGLGQQLPIELAGHVRASRADLDRRPLTRGVELEQRLRHVDDRARAAGLIGAGVVDV